MCKNGLDLVKFTRFQGRTGMWDTVRPCGGRRKRTAMKEFVAVIFGLGLLCNALLFVPQAIAVWRKKSDEGISLITFGGFSVLQAIGIVHGLYQRDPSLILGMAASLLSCGTVTLLTIYYRMRRRRGEVRP
jgi:MtN3 and saliva related transmembrane protein